MSKTREVAEKIVALCKENGCTIRGYEGEVSSVIIELATEQDPVYPEDYGAEIINGTMEIDG